MKKASTSSQSPTTGPALAAMALGGLAIGTTEFASMGLLPAFAADLGATVPQAGTAISAYALGVVVGAPVLAVLGARWPRKHLVLALAGALAVTNVASAFAPTFGTFVATRFLAGLPHGAYFGTASVLAASLVPRERRPRAIATVMSGLMIANIVGVPGATWLGQNAGWPAAYLTVGAVAALTMLAVWRLVPDVRDERRGSVLGELSALRRGQVWITMAVIATGFGGSFAVYSYITPVLTEVSGLATAAVPLALAVFGVGMTLGNQVGGRLAETAPVRTIASGLAAAAVSMALFALTASSPVFALVTLFALAFTTTATTPALATRLMDAGREGPTLGAALHHAAFNVSNALGAALGALVLAAGWGWTAPAAVATVLPLLGLAALGVAVRMERSERREELALAA
ncbi:MFS transporter [Pseudonocardia alni]|jgi:DHA1 family inner membrane transport protein|uniref:DHA1 family inner membrane transport protein n=1 Tax=Pseudonocardia alni TaxID=33907 RepID=A0A852VY51_PSEA5|nr:MFS transporter [Pseudonocardia antarctica]NYG01733.1 DHA1 family inner membrane transport protein [Pseudonocardia antarctica]OJG06049.1 Inner membrane transport protein YdhP [Pseudonocardia autotrophica]